jgi:hypothetical protein
MQKSSMEPESFDLLVLTDSESADDQALYPSVGSSVGSTSVSIRLPAGTAGTSQPVVVERMERATGEPGNVWSGHLAIPSGALLVSDWSMKPLARHEVRPGVYRVDVQGEAATLTVMLSPSDADIF